MKATFKNTPDEFTAEQRPSTETNEVDQSKFSNENLTNFFFDKIENR